MVILDSLLYNSLPAVVRDEVLAVVQQLAWRDLAALPARAKNLATALVYGPAS